MSRIYFHAENAEAEVLGSERAFMGRLTQNVAGGVFALLSDDRLREIVPADSYVVTDDRSQPGALGSAIYLRRNFDLWLSGSSGHFADGEEVFTVVLNTALAVGSDALKLAARLHGQCELHAYIEGEDREWFADMIRDARSHVLRDGAGWESVCDLLRDGDSPVVTSYSVCEGFPNAGVAAWEPEPDRFGGTSDEAWDAWYDLPAAERWRLGMEGLQTQNERLALRMEPSAWADFYFGSGRNAFDYLRPPVPA